LTWGLSTLGIWSVSWIRENLEQLKNKLYFIITTNTPIFLPPHHIFTS
jgi:hypothetical protein